MAINEGIVFDGLDLHDDTNYTIEMVDFAPPPSLAEWIRSADSSGSLLSREPPFDNVENTFRVRVAQQATMDLALAKIGAIQDKCQEAARNPVTGVDLVWTPANSTKSLTGKVLRAEIVDLPKEVQGDGAGWFVNFPVLTVRIVRYPFWYGAEVVGSSSSSTLPLYTVELTGVTGDVPADIRVIVTDNASKDRRLVRVGLESRYYPTSSPPGLILDSDGLVTSGFAGTGTTRSGAYDPGAAGNSVIRGTLAKQPAAVCGTGNQSHVGTFRVFARVWAAAATTGTVFVRLAYQDGDGPMRPNTYTTPPVVNNWAEVDLGLITVTEKQLGTQRWTGIVQAYSTVIGETLDVDYLALMPAAEGYGQASGTFSYQPGVLVARDEFTGTTAGNNLSARVAPSGGTWATSGPGANDFKFFDGPGTGETIRRSAGSDDVRYGILGSTNYTNTEVGVDIQSSSYGAVRQAVIARWVDSSNYAAIVVTDGSLVEFEIMVAGTDLGSSFSVPTQVAGTWRSLRLVIFASGSAFISVLDSGGAVVGSLSAYHSSLATGGALATGKPGVYDTNGGGGAVSRYYDNFYAATPAGEGIVCYSSQSIEFRQDGMLREDSTGTYWGQPSGPRAGLRGLPVAGTRGRKARIAVMAKRNNTTLNPDDQIADSVTVQINYTPKFLSAPR